MLYVVNRMHCTFMSYVKYIENVLKLLLKCECYEYMTVLTELNAF